MIPAKLSSLLRPKGAHTHNHDGTCCGHDHHHHGEAHKGPSLDDHEHAHVPFWVVCFGGLLILNSYIADHVFGVDSLQSVVSALAAALLLSLPIFWTTVKDLYAGRLFMNELVALALLAAFVGEDYRTAAAVAFFMLLAIMIEHRTAAGALAAIEGLIRMTPRRALKIEADGSQVEVEASSLRPGDLILVRPGDALPVDGVITQGSSSLNQSSITGESLPVDKSDNDDVFAGTQNLTGALTVKVTRTGSDTTLGQVRSLIEQAEASRPPVMRMIDRYAAYYVPVVLLLAGIAYYFSDFNLNVLVAMLVVACPCALVVATPSAVVAAVASCARLGVLVRDVAQLEVAAKIRAIVLDKTGTLTQGILEVSRLQPAEGVPPADLLRAALSAEGSSTHPVARAIVRLAEEAGLKYQSPSSVTEEPGRGVQAKGPEGHCLAGRRSWLDSLKIDTSTCPDADSASGKSLVYVAKDGRCLGWIALADKVRPEAREAVRLLRELGINDIAMVTGDNASVAHSIAAEVGITEIHSECLPAQKAAKVAELKAAGMGVAVVGDGVNDAPALASGDVGIAMGAAGSDIAVNSASVTLMNSDLRRVPYFITLSRRTRAVMTQNLAIGILSIAIGMTFSALGYLNGVSAAILHTVSTLVIIMNSARLVREGEELEIAAKS